MFYIRRLVRQKIVEWITIHRGADDQHDLFDNLQRHRRHRDSVHHSLREAEGTQCQHQCLSQHRRKRIELEAEMEFIQHHFVLRLGCLVRQRTDERFAIHGAGHGQRNLYVDLHRRGRQQRLSVHDRLRQVADAHRQPERGSQRDHQRRQCDLELVVHQCDLLLGLRCLVGRAARERFAIHGSADGQRDLYVDLHRRGRQRLAVRDGDRNRKKKKIEKERKDVEEE